MVSQRDAAMTDRIDYGTLMHDAMRGLIRRVLEDVRDNGLPGEHHFFITFDTMHPDVEIADWLSDRFPDEMTIVMQHWFGDLDPQDDGFTVTLNFGDSPEPLYIPYDAIITFVDPSVEFGLRFEATPEDENGGADIEELDGPPAPMAEDVPQPDIPVEAEVVSLDAFRKT